MLSLGCVAVKVPSSLDCWFGSLEPLLSRKLVVFGGSCVGPAWSPVSLPAGELRWCFRLSGWVAVVGFRGFFARFARLGEISGFSGCAGVAGQVLHDGLKSFSP